jgi:hypothetical protein
MAFFAPMVLGALAVLGIPVILHLMARDVPKTIHFSSLRFITTDKLKTQSKRGLRDLLLLLMRCLAIAALVFAFSKPFIPAVNKQLVATSEVVVLIDNSASMNRTGFKESLLAVLAEKLDDKASSALIISSNGVTDKKDFGTKQDLMSAVEKMSLGLSEGHHEDALNEVSLLFHKDAINKKLIIISDFNRQDWNLNQAPNFKDIDLEFINPFEKKRDNISVYVDRLRRLNGGDIVQAQILLSNYSNNLRETVVSFTSGQKKVEQKISLLALESKKIVMTMENPESSKAIVKISPDEYVYDDEFHLWIGEEAPIKVAFPEKEEGQSLDYVFVQKALQAVKSADASFRVVPVDSQLFSPEDLNDFQVVVLTDPAFALQADLYDGLKKFVSDGGLLICAPATRAGMILSRLQAHGLADVKFEKKVQKKSRLDLPYRFEVMSEKSDVLEMFGNTQDSDLQQFPIYTYNQLDCGGTGVNLLEIKKGTPGITEFPLGKGKVIISAIPFNHVWSDFTLSNSFLPLLRQLIITNVGSELNSVVKLNFGAKKMLSGSDELIDTTKVGSLVIDEMPVVVNVSRLESQENKLNLIDFKSRLRDSPGNKITVQEESVDGDEYWQYFFLLAVIALLTEFMLADFRGIKQRA